MIDTWLWLGGGDRGVGQNVDYKDFAPSVYNLQPIFEGNLHLQQKFKIYNLQGKLTKIYNFLLHASQARCDLFLLLYQV